MIIGVVPSIKETYSNQIEISLDIKLINFLKKFIKILKLIFYIKKNFPKLIFYACLVEMI